MTHPKLLVSACLLGAAVRYDGGHKKFDHELLCQWVSEGRVIGLCPEVEGGLSVPRPPAEIASDGRVRTHFGDDLTEAFEKGAERALAMAIEAGCSLALLTDKSPSCGVHQVYDGAFDGRTRPGQGITAARLSGHGIEIFSTHQFSELAERMA